MDNIKIMWFLFGHQTIIPDEYATPSNSGFYRFYYVRNGNCILHDGKETFLLEKGNVYIIPRKSYAFTYGESNQFDHILGHFQIEGWQFNNLIQFRPENDKTFEDFIRLLNQLFDTVLHNPKQLNMQTDMTCLFSDDKFFPVLSNTMSALVTYLYLSIYRVSDTKDALDHVVDYINNHLDHELTNDTLAKIAKYSRAYFIQEFTKKYGISPQKYVVKARISQAIVMLMGDEKAYNIAYKIGYDNPKSFARAFKREVGLSPKNYKALHYDTIHNFR